MSKTILLGIRSEIDIYFAQSECIKFVENINFLEVDLSLISTIVQELSTNILKYAQKGKMRFSIIEENKKTGVLIEAIDKGPSIKDIEKALTDHYSTSGTLGLGLPGVKRISNKLIINSTPEKGTHIKATYFPRI